MLLLRCKEGESIRVDGHQVTVTQVRGSYVKLGIDAPKEIPVHRESVFQKIQLEDEGDNEKATTE